MVDEVENKITAMQKYRSNPETRYKEQRRKVIRNIKKGVNIRKSTLDKYKISVDDYNNMRINEGLNKVEFATPVPMSDNPIVDAARKQHDMDLIKSRNDKLEEGIKKAKQVNRELSKEYTETMVDGRFDYDTLNLETAISFIHELKDINITTKKRHGNNLRRLLLDSKLCKTHSDNIIPCLKKSDTIIKKYIYKRFDNPNTRLGYIKAVNKIINEYPLLKKRIPDKVIKWLNNEFDKLSTLAKAQRAANVGMEIPSFTKMREKIESTFPENSTERLIFELYDEFPARDDFGDVKLIKRVKDATDKNQNYLVMRKQPIFILRVFKTDSKYPEIKHKFSENIYDMLIAQGKKAGDYMITNKKGNIYKDGILSGMISNMLKKAGIDRKGQRGAINIFRKSKLTELTKNASPWERVRIATMAAHSPATTLTYIRKAE